MRRGSSPVFSTPRLFPHLHSYPACPCQRRHTLWRGLLQHAVCACGQCVDCRSNRRPAVAWHGLLYDGDVLDGRADPHRGGLLGAYRVPLAGCHLREPPRVFCSRRVCGSSSASVAHLLSHPPGLLVPTRRDFISVDSTPPSPSQGISQTQTASLGTRASASSTAAASSGSLASSSPSSSSSPWSFYGLNLVAVICIAVAVAAVLVILVVVCVCFCCRSYDDKEPQAAEPVPLPPPVQVRGLSRHRFIAALLSAPLAKPPSPSSGAPGPLTAAARALTAAARALTTAAGAVAYSAAKNGGSRRTLRSIYQRPDASGARVDHAPAGSWVAAADRSAASGLRCPRPVPGAAAARRSATTAEAAVDLTAEGQRRCAPRHGHAASRPAPPAAAAGAAAAAPAGTATAPARPAGSRRVAANALRPAVCSAAAALPGCPGGWRAARSGLLCSSESATAARLGHNPISQPAAAATATALLWVAHGHTGSIAFQVLV